jgi:uncharacterized membrane protein YbhN (UPF0104 family)
MGGYTRSGRARGYALGVPAAIAGPTILIDRLLGMYLPAVVGWYPTMRLDLP